MSGYREKPKPILFIREICAGLPEEQLLEAEENFKGFLIVIKEMCDRIEQEASLQSFDDQIRF